jgi:hypothetical protein
MIALRSVAMLPKPLARPLVVVSDEFEQPVSAIATTPAAAATLSKRFLEMLITALCPF